MQISVTDAKGQLTELVRRAEKGDEIVLTRHGHPAARLGHYSKSYEFPALPGQLPDQAPRVVRISSMETTACRNDRRRYFRVDGDRPRRGGSRGLYCRTGSRRRNSDFGRALARSPPR